MLSSSRTVGRSVEEVILLRKLNQQNNELTLPAIKHSNSLTQMPGNSHTFIPLVPRRQEKRLVSANAVYSEEDVRRMMEEMASYTRSLQNRVKNLEAELLSVPRNTVATAKDGGGGLSRVPTSQHDPDINTSNNFNTNNTRQGADATRNNTAASSRALTSTLAATSTALQANNHRAVSLAHDAITSIDTKVVNLKDIFRRKDPIEERHEAAVKIQTMIRGYVVRCRRKAYLVAQKEWRWQRCRPVVWLLDILLSNQSKLDTGFHLLKMNRTMRTMLVFFGKWSFICRQNAPLRRAMREGAQQRIERKRKELLKKVFDGLHAASIGSLSTKNAIAERRVLIDRIRKDLSEDLLALGMVGIVPEDEVFRVLHRKVVEQFNERKKQISLRAKFSAFVKLRAMSAKFEKEAERHRFGKLTGKAFYAWSDYTYLKSRGLDRKRWPGPRKYEVRYNQKRVDHFAKIRCERFVFSYWKSYFIMQLIVKRKFQKKKAQYISRVFGSWRAMAKHQRALRKNVYENWSGYSRLLTTTPFRAWSDFVKGQKNLFNEHIRIARSYRRWKMRQKVGEIVKRWRHQALFGRIDGLYTRQMLLKSLGEQKIFTSSLEKVMADQVLELEESKNAVRKESEKRKATENEVTKLNNEVNKVKMTVHNYEQEIKRLQSILTTMKTINPKQMEHLDLMQGEFRFKERNIAISNSNHADHSHDGASGSKSGRVVAPGQEQSVVTNSSADNKPISARKNDNNNATSGMKAFDNSGVVEKSATSDSVDINIASESSQKEMEMSFDLVDKEGKQNDVLANNNNNGVNNNSNSNPSANGSTSADPNSANSNAVSEEEASLLRRVKWLLARYREALPADHYQHAEHLVLNYNDHAENDTLHGNAMLSQLTMRLANGNISNNNAGSRVGSEQNSLAPRSYNMIGDVPPSDNNSVADSAMEDSQSFSLPSFKRSSLLKRSNSSVIARSSNGMVLTNVQGASNNNACDSPFVAREREASSGSLNNLNNNPNSNGEEGNVVVRKLSMIRKPSSLLNINAVTNATRSVSQTNLLDQKEGREEFYSDEELESLVITWAKMMVSFFDFLHTGDITILPEVDKQAWLLFLLQQSKGSGNNDDQPPSSLPADSNAPMCAIRTAFSTQPPPPALDWRSGLLTLRSMFPGAGNFSGLGISLLEEREVSLAQRTLHMHREVRDIERDYARRYLKHFVERQIEEAQGQKAQEKAGGENKLFVYASNLEKVVKRERETEQERDYRDSEDFALRQLMPSLGGDDKEGSAEEGDSFSTERGGGSSIERQGDGESSV